MELGIGHLPAVKAPESAMLPGMAAPRPTIVPQRATGSIWMEPSGRVMRQTPTGPVVLVPDPPGIPWWNYDFDPATGSARAAFNGEIAMTGSATLNGSAIVTGAGAVTSFNTRTGAVSLQQSDVSAVAVGSFNGRTGAINPTQGDYNTNQILATGTNDNAPAGDIGEFISATLAQGSAVALTANTAANLTSISLTAGDWDVEGILGFVMNASTQVSYLGGGVTTTSATAPANAAPGAVYIGFGNVTGLPVQTIPTSRMRLSINATTTVFLVAFATFAVQSASGFGFIRARRPR